MAAALAGAAGAGHTEREASIESAAEPVAQEEEERAGKGSGLVLKGLTHAHILAQPELLLAADTTKTGVELEDIVSGTSSERSSLGSVMEDVRRRTWSLHEEHRIEAEERVQDCGTANIPEAFLTRTPSVAAVAAVCRTTDPQSSDWKRKADAAERKCSISLRLVVIGAVLVTILALASCALALVLEDDGLKQWAHELDQAVAKAVGGPTATASASATSVLQGSASGSQVRGDFDIAKVAAQAALERAGAGTVELADAGAGRHEDAFGLRLAGDGRGDGGEPSRVVSSCGAGGGARRRLRGGSDTSDDCVQVRTVNWQLSGGRSVLVVLPDAPLAPGVNSGQLSRIIEEELEQVYVQWHHRRTSTLLPALIVLAVLVAAIGFGAERFLLHPLRRMRRLLDRLAELDFMMPGTMTAATAAAAGASMAAKDVKAMRCCGRSSSASSSASSRAAGGGAERSRIREVSTLQRALDRLESRMQTFSRFIPATIARNILVGDERSSRLHVDERLVTIMFSDIQDFTRLCEKLSRRDFVFVITRYLSVMTSVVEMYGGVVAEILGDGLLAFWNTPDNVTDHAGKACAAALAQQKALELLNEQFASLGLSSLKIRIGIHTGTVLAGTIGCEKRMKFGCIGNSINLASRLEGLCKVYGVQVICSGSTKEAVPKDAFAFRKLDVVQVKGKCVSTDVYEVIEQVPIMDSSPLAGAGDQSPPLLSPDTSPASSPFSMSPSPHIRQGSQQSGGGGFNGSRQTSAMRVAYAEDYERALAAYQKGDFLAAREILTRLVQENTTDVAAARLLDKTKQFFSEDGQQVVGLSPEEIKAWTGHTTMTEK